MSKIVNIDEHATITIYDRGIYVERIRAIWHKSREQILELGKALIEAKRDLDHGEFTAMIENDLPFTPDTAQHLMRIARDPRVSNPVILPHLPASVHALDEIRKLDDGEIEDAITAGDIHPQMTVEDARALIRAPQRDTIRTDARATADLKQPIVGYHDLLATMKGYRAAQSLSQLATDDLAGTQDGYIGKLEIDIRRAVNESWWGWMHALRLVMVLIPAVDAVRADKCPCCMKEMG